MTATGHHVRCSGWRYEGRGRRWLNGRFGCAVACMTARAANDAEVTADAGGLLVHITPRSEFFIAERRVIREGGFVLHSRHREPGVRGLLWYSVLLRARSM